MTTQTQAQPNYRKDYAQPDYWIDRVELSFFLEETETIVRARLSIRRNLDKGGAEPLVLLGEELELRSVAIDERTLSPSEYLVDEESLTISEVPESFTLETEVKIDPAGNTKLMGLYATSGNYCTQCEAEGFRRITYFLDRPDVMARYTTRIEAAKERCPVMLSNGNRVDGGELANGRHWVLWEDPFPKPSYLFALVAGDLKCHGGSYTTKSGREVRLEIWVEPQNIDACEHALRSLQRSMKWDEDVFGLEYDLDIYMIVAVNDFNMGAMENKGLNVFNSKYVLARPETATDDDYEGVEGVIAHEYFHNWTGNRVTCRDWFQLTLKEGLTVFRDQQFSSDMNSAPVVRIGDVRVLRTMQFAEAAGPMAHPIRPESYIEMNNFYTVTVYNKGAEVIRMYHTLLGVEGFRKGMDLYFERHDGGAVTCDDFRAAMADANGRDLDQFERWYSQAGTPTITARGEWDAAAKTYVITLSQSCSETKGEAAPQPFHLPVRLGLLGPDGADLPLVLEGESGAGSTERVLELTTEEASFRFTGIDQAPVPSLLRNFSAPVRLKMDRDPEELAFLMGHDADAFNRWDAGQTLAKRVLLALVEDLRAGRELALDPLFLEAFGKVLADPKLDGSLKAQALVLPSEKELGLEMSVVDPDSLFEARQFARRALAAGLRDSLVHTLEATASTGPYVIEKAEVDRRRLHNVCLAYLVSLGDADSIARAEEQFGSADNMTEVQAALTCLANVDDPARERALESFYGRWRSEPLVLDKWFGVQATSCLPDTLARVVELSKHADFTLANPNRARALIGSFAAGNQVRFHAADGAGYRFHADQVLALDDLNPQVASRMVSQFNSWRRFDEARQGLMRAELERIAAKDGLSKDVAEIVGRNLAD